MDYTRGTDITSALKYMYQNKYGLETSVLADCHNIHEVVYAAEMTQVPDTAPDFADANIGEVFNLMGDYYASNQLIITMESKVFVYDGASHKLSAATTNATKGTTKIEYSADGGETWTTRINDISATDVADSVTVQVRASNVNYSRPATKTVQLTITERPVLFTGRSETKTATGSEITINTVDVTNGGFTVGGLVSGHSHNVTFSASGTDVGEYEGTITDKDSVVITSGLTDVTANYAIRVENGTLTIEAAEDNSPGE